MPPKRGRGKGGAAPRGKATKRKTKGGTEEPSQKLQKEESFNSKLKRAITEVKSEGTSKARTFKADANLAAQCNNKAVVHEDYACMLNQSNIGNNNNKFYVIQVAKHGKDFITYTRWGRVGENGMDSLQRFPKVESAIDAFKKKFKDKTKNDWDQRENFTAKPGKYTLLEMDDDDDDVDQDAIDAKIESKSQGGLTSSGVKSTLDARTFLMIKLIFSSDMFINQMAQMKLDVRRMPLGKLSKSQIAKGLEALIEIQEAIKTGKNATVLADLTSKFYTLIPHDFGRMKPPVMDNEAVVDQKKEVMMILSDIELTQSLQKEQIGDQLTHPLDEKYQTLDCQLQLLDKTSDEFKLLDKYSNACKGYRNGKLLDVWKVDRKGSDNRFNQHKNISFRKLLWHGTSVAVVAAILKAGLRIMPHSGGCVGKGIYFASEHSKSAGYVGCHYGKFEKEDNVGFMFLTEVALGNMKFITMGDSGLKSAPKGYDSIVARGRTEPDPKKDTKIKFGGRDVIVPIGSAIKQKEYENSHFSQSEYLIYKESQARIRYLLKFSF